MGKVTLKSIGRAFSSAANTVVSGATNAANTVVSGATNAANTVVSGATNAANTVATGTTNAVNTVVSGTTNAVNTVVSGTTNAANTVATGTTNVVNKAEDLANKGANITNVISKTTQNILKETTNTLNTIAKQSINFLDVLGNDYIGEVVKTIGNEGYQSVQDCVKKANPDVTKIKETADNCVNEFKQAQDAIRQKAAESAKLVAQAAKQYADVAKNAINDLKSKGIEQGKILGSEIQKIAPEEIAVAEKAAKILQDKTNQFLKETENFANKTVDEINAFVKDVGDTLKNFFNQVGDAIKKILILVCPTLVTVFVEQAISKGSSQLCGLGTAQCTPACTFLLGANPVSAAVCSTTCGAATAGCVEGINQASKYALQGLKFDNVELCKLLGLAPPPPPSFDSLKIDYPPLPNPQCDEIDIFNGLPPDYCAIPSADNQNVLEPPEPIPTLNFDDFDF